MAKLNNTKTAVKAQTIKAETTTNYEGAEAYTLGAKQRLIERVLGSLWNEDTFYAKGKTISDGILEDIVEVAASDPKFILQLAAFARNEIYLRTTPQVLLASAARLEACKPYIREYTPKIVKRADELTEVVAYYLEKYGKPIPNSLKKGLQDAFANFDEYQLNKYDSDGNAVSLGDVARLVHPALGKGLYAYLTTGEVDAEALPKTAALKALLAKNSIDEEALGLIRKSSVTWETLISKFGSTKETWELVAPNMGYMALLRNLRNFDEKGVDIDPILARITDPEAVKKSKQLPFRFYSAYKQLVSKQKIARAVAKAFEASISNVTLDGDTAIFIDLSNSMTQNKISAKSDVSQKEIAAVLAAITVKKASNSIIVGFGNTAQEIALNPDDTMITNVQKILDTNVGLSTNAWKAFEVLGNRKVDRILLFSDMQCYDSGKRGYDPGYGWGYDGTPPEAISKKWNEYRKVNKDAFLYSFDLNAYGTAQTNSQQKNVVLLNGWSDKIIDYVTLTEKRGAVEANIKKW